MKRAWNSNYAYALLVWLSVFSCGLYASTLMERSRASKTHAGSEPFATFHLLDRQLSLLGRQSAVLQKTVSSPQPGNLKAAKTWRKAATDMGQTVNRIEKLAHNLQRRYRGKPFARRLFGRLSAHAASVQSALRVVRSADSPVRARTAASEVDKGIVSPQPAIQRDHRWLCGAPLRARRMDVLRAQTARRSLIAGRVSLALYKKGPTLSRVCGSPRGRAEVIAAVRVRQGRSSWLFSRFVRILDAPVAEKA